MKKKLSDKWNSMQMIAMRTIKEPRHAIRSNFDKDKMNQLVESIQKVGLIEPIILVEVKGGYEIVAGHRRFIAHKHLGLKEIKAVVLEATAKDTEVMKLHENMIREDVNVIDESNFIKTLMKIHAIDQKEISRMIGRSEAYVSQRLDVLKYDEKLLNALADEKISFSVARELNRIDDEVMRDNYLHHAVMSGVTPATMKQWVDDYLRMQEIQSGEYDPKKILKDQKGMDEVQLPCQVCKDVKPASESIMVRICRTCVKEMKI